MLSFSTSSSAARTSSRLSREWSRRSMKASTARSKWTLFSQSVSSPSMRRCSYVLERDGFGFGVAAAAAIGSWVSW